MSQTQEIASLVSGYTDLKQYFEGCRNEMQPFMAVIGNANTIELEVGPGKQFGHPAEAADHINSSIFSKSVLWRIKVSPGIYQFPLNNTRTIHIGGGIHFEIIGTEKNATEVVLEFRSEYHDWGITAINGSHGVIKNLTIKDPRAMNVARVDQVSGRNMKDNNAGGILHGAIAKKNSSLTFDNVHFENCWHSVGVDENSQVYIYNCSGINLIHGPYSWGTSNIYSHLCDWVGIGANGGIRHGNGFSMSHGGLASCQGIKVRGFRHAMYAQWGANVHFNRHHSWGGDDGRTAINEVDTEFKDCDRGFDVHWGATAAMDNILVSNMKTHILHTTQNTAIYVAPNSIMDSAVTGISARHGACVVANHSTWRNISGTVFDAWHKAEIHAGGTSDKFVNVGVQYSPAAAYTLGNHDSYIYR